MRSVRISVTHPSGGLVGEGLCVLDQDPAGRRRMQEADHAGEAGPRLLVDHSDALGFGAGQLGVDVVGLEAEVVDAFAAFGQELADAALVGKRLQELDLAFADREQRRVTS